MKSDWTWRWWDLAAVVVTVAAAVWVVQYSLARQSIPAQWGGPAIIKVRVANPLPELMAQVRSGDVLRNAKAERIGMILAVEKLGVANGLLSSMLHEKIDLLITVNVEGPLRLTRDLPGFPREPGDLKAGTWCLLVTDQVELSGVIVAVKHFGSRPVPSPGRH